MPSTLQTVLALALVLLALAFLLRSWFGKRRQTGCAGGCREIDSGSR